MLCLILWILGLGFTDLQEKLLESSLSHIKEQKCYQKILLPMRKCAMS